MISKFKSNSIEYFRIFQGIPNCSGEFMGNPMINFCDDYNSDEPCCPDPKIALNEDAYRVCLNCGCVHRRELSNQERRAYTVEEINSRRRTERKVAILWIANNDWKY